MHYSFETVLYYNSPFVVRHNSPSRLSNVCLVAFHLMHANYCDTYNSSRSLPGSPNPQQRGPSSSSSSSSQQQQPNNSVPHYTSMMSSSLYQISIPDGLESRTYGSLYRLLSRRKQIPLGECYNVAVRPTHDITASLVALSCFNFL